MNSNELLYCWFLVDLHQHLTKHEVDYLQFSFRWMNNLLMRELPLKCTVRLWDTCLGQTNGFADFHLYTCAAFLLKWRTPLLRHNDFQVQNYTHAFSRYLAKNDVLATSDTLF